MTLSSIDPSKIIWIKSVDRGETSLWAYCGEDPTTRHFEPRREGDEFGLHWPTRLRWNVQGPQRGDIICLTQAMHVTHLARCWTMGRMSALRSTAALGHETRSTLWPGRSVPS